MAFHGLFIGVDHYASADVNWLQCAVRDATALHALFADTLGGGAVLLRDEEATRAAVEQAFVRLQSTSADDVVVVAFSGHGSDTHELVTYDADIGDLAGTCIPLSTLTEWFLRIPARRLVCFLDCCFSGGMGAKVLSTGLKPRSLASTAALLDQLSGEGRLIFTASSATEPAWENVRTGHGLLTYNLLEALQGAEEVLREGKVSIYRLLEHVSRRVTDAAAQLRREQHPTLRGTIDEAMTWPVLKPGPLYHAAFPERTARPPVTGDVDSLLPYGFPPGLLDAWRGSIPSLNDLQIDAVNEFGLLDGEHLVVSAPTSSGKTAIGELAALRGIVERRRAFFLLPLKALVNDKHRYFTRTFGAFGVRTIRATGEMSDDVATLMRGRYDLCLLTYEKFAALVLANPYLLEQVGTVVIDEVQMIADATRGANLEFILTLLRMQRQHGITPQTVALSAVIGDPNGLEGWLGARLLLRTRRPVPLDEGLLLANGNFRSVDSETGKQTIHRGYVQRELRKGSSQDYVIPLVRKLVAEGKQVIVFRETRGAARGCARYLARALGLPPAREALDALPDGDPSLATRVLRETLEGGVAFHISDLDRDERLVVEENFRRADSTLRVIAATTTLAMGVNTPASAVVIVGLEHPGNAAYTVAEYKNIVGRAGRLGYAERGASFLLALDPLTEQDFWKRYVQGKPEDLVSRFCAPETDEKTLVLQTLVAAKKGADQGLSPEAVIEFLESSFGAYQQMRQAGTWRWDQQQIAVAVAVLKRHQLITEHKDKTLHLTALGRLTGEGGIKVASVIALAALFRGMTPETFNGPTLVAATQLTEEVSQLPFPLNKSSAIQEPRRWPAELHAQRADPRVVAALGAGNDPHVGTLRAKKAVACLLWISPFSLEDIEDLLTQHGGKFDGAAGPVRNVCARTCDLLPFVAKVAEVIHPDLSLEDTVARLLARLETGAPAPATDLCRRLGTALNRGDYQRLTAAGCAEIKQIAERSDEVLLNLVGDTPVGQEKVRRLRQAVEAFKQEQRDRKVADQPLPIYEE